MTHKSSLDDKKRGLKLVVKTIRKRYKSFVNNYENKVIREQIFENFLNARFWLNSAG